MKKKVLRIIRDVLKTDTESLQNVIQASFQTSLAKEILEADFYSSDEYEIPKTKAVNK